MAYILHENGLVDILREETSAAIGLEPLQMVKALDQCPRLEAVFHETLRLVGSSVSVRKVVAPTVLGGKELLPGRDVLVPFRQLHLNPDVFGFDADRFNSTRFLNEALKKNPSFRPFGGGTTLCPGRFLAKREVMAFVALSLNRLNVEVVGRSGACSRVPRLHTKVPSLGILPPVPGEDVTIRISGRGKGEVE